MRSGPGRGEADRVAARVRAVVGGGGEPGGKPDDFAAPRTRRDRLPLRLDPGRRPVVAIGVAVLVAALATGLWLVSSRPRTMPVSAAAPTIAGASDLVPSTGPRSSVSSSAVPSSMSSSTSSVSAAAPPGQVVVDVAGKVRRPGLYRLPPGSRVDDALKAAGGALRGVDLSSLNLAAKLVDGQQIPVGRPGAAALPAAGGAAAPSGDTSAGTPGAPVDLNTATVEQLDALPGIGPALAQRILDYRTEKGSFRSVDQLDDVSGIGTVIFARLKPLVSV